MQKVKVGLLFWNLPEGTRKGMKDLKIVGVLGEIRTRNLQSTSQNRYGSGKEGRVYAEIYNELISKVVSFSLHLSRGGV